MSHLVDIALDPSGRMTAMAAEVRLHRGILFLALESTSADPAAAPLVQAALGAFVATAACTTATSPARMLDQAFEAANRATCDIIQRNRSLQGILISAAAVLSTGDHLHVASAGANGVYLRTQGQTRRLVDPETPATRLAMHGLSADETRNVDNNAVNGLGLPPEVFALRQSRSLSEPDSYLLVLCGAGIDSLITPAHISTITPAAGDMSVTATRLFRQFGDRLMTPSAVLAAHRSGSKVESSPFRYSIAMGERPSRRFAGPLPFALLALAVLALLVYLYQDRSAKETPPPPVAPPPSLLQTSPAQGPGEAGETSGSSTPGGEAPAGRTSDSPSPIAPLGNPASGAASEAVDASSTPPADGSAPPAASSAPPAGGSAPPADGSAPPADGSAPPADGSAPPPAAEGPSDGRVSGGVALQPGSGAASESAGMRAASPQPKKIKQPPPSPGARTKPRAQPTALPAGRPASGGPVAVPADAAEGPPSAPDSGEPSHEDGPDSAPEAEAPAASADSPPGSDVPLPQADPPAGNTGQNDGEPATPDAGPGAQSAGEKEDGQNGTDRSGGPSGELPAGEEGIQVMDFTQPEKEEGGEDAAPTHRPFPSINLDPAPMPPEPPSV